MTLTLEAESTAAPTLPPAPSWAAASATGVSDARFISARPVEKPGLRLAAVSILGERFFLEREDGYLFLVHPTWSLVGSGMDIQGLFEDLRSEAEEMLDIFADDPAEALSDQSRAMLQFAAELTAL